MRQRMMMLKKNSPAIHTLGDIGQSEIDEAIDVWEETEDTYIGAFCEGFGFINVVFKKQDVRPLTLEEIAEKNRKWYAINETPMYKIELDKDGYYPECEW